jgi:hypothetical protein
MAIAIEVIPGSGVPERKGRRLAATAEPLSEQVVGDAASTVLAASRAMASIEAGIDRVWYESLVMA